MIPESLDAVAERFNFKQQAAAPEHFLGDYPQNKWRQFSHALPSDLSGASVLDIHFDGGTDGFAYADDMFKATVQPIYASGAQLPSGGFSAGGLQVLLGGVNGSNIQKISGGWARTFSLAAAGQTTLTFRYKLSIANLKSERFGQVLVSVNGVLYGVPPNTYVAQLMGGLGGISLTTGWQQVTINLGSLPAGTHTLALGGYLSGKSGSSETVEIVVDDVNLTQ